MLIFVQCVRKVKTMTKNKQTKKSVKAKTKKKDVQSELSKALQKKIKSQFPNIKSKYVGDGMTEFSFD